MDHVDPTSTVRFPSRLAGEELAEEMSTARPIDAGQPEDVHGHTLRAPQRQPLRLGEKPLVPALGVGREWRFLGHEGSSMIAIDASGGEIGDPAELARARGEIVGMLPQHGVALSPGRRGDHNMGDTVERTLGQWICAVEHHGTVAFRADRLRPVFAAARGGDGPAFGGKPLGQHAGRKPQPEAQKMVHAVSHSRRTS